jgi:prephenate dehydratase
MPPTPAKKPATKRPSTNGQPSAAPKVTYQGEPGANSHIAALAVFPDCDAIACPTFEDALSQVAGGQADFGMIPIENSVAGRVADIHHLLPKSGLFITAEYFLRVRHQLMALPGVTITDVAQVFSHVQALGQCRNTLRKLGLKPVVAADTAGSARLVAETKARKSAAIASELAAEIYGLNILARDIEDETHNTTRFVILEREADDATPGSGPVMTTLIFRVRNVPAALYKAMGGFATNGVNMTKLESYMEDGTFSATMFYADIEGHPADRPVQLALEELSFFSTEVRVLGCYPASPHRVALKARQG